MGVHSKTSMSKFSSEFVYWPVYLPTYWFSFIHIPRVYGWNASMVQGKKIHISGNIDMII